MDFWVVFQPLAVVNGAAENIVEQVFVWTCVVSALGPTPRTGVAGASGSYAELPEEPVAILLSVTFLPGAPGTDTLGHSLAHCRICVHAALSLWESFAQLVMKQPTWHDSRHS